MSKIEEVARALAPKAWATKGFPLEDSLANENRRTASLRHARAAIEAMRQPTNAMIDAGGLDGEETWWAMIDAALK